MLKKEEQPGAEGVALERKKQFEAVCQLLLQVGEVLAAPALEDLTPAQSGGRHEVREQIFDPHLARCGLQGAENSCGSLEEQKAIILVPHDFPLAGAKRIRSKWLDDYTASGAEVKSRLVATEVACGNRRLVLCLRVLAALGSQLGGITRKETRVLRRGGGVSYTH